MLQLLELKSFFGGGVLTGLPLSHQLLLVPDFHPSEKFYFKRVYDTVQA